MDRDVSVPLRYIAPSEPLRVGEACLKDIRHDILALVALMVQLILYYYLLVMMRFPPLPCLRVSAPRVFLLSSLC